MSDRSIFSGPVLVVLVASATAVFALSVVLMLAGPSEEHGAGSDTKSISALGYAGLYELAQRFDVPVARSQLQGIVEPGEGGVLVMAEPPAVGLSGDAIIRLGRAANVLLVLPKRDGTPDKDNPSWVKSTTMIDPGVVAGVARLVDPAIDVKPDGSAMTWTTNRIGIDPTFDGGVQLIIDPALTSIVGNADGTLIGEKLDGSRRIWILSDPDIIENHGLTKGKNAAFAIALLNTMRDPGGSVVFDETIHGMVNVVENPLRKLLQFPYLIVLLLSLAGAALLLWASISRFGQPRLAPPAFDFGKRRLIATTSSLLDRAGHQAFVMRRYVENTVRDAGRLFRAPRQLDGKALADWLDVIGEARGIEQKSATILARSTQTGLAGRPSLTGLFEATRDIHKWKEEISDGTSARRGNR